MQQCGGGKDRHRHGTVSQSGHLDGGNLELTAGSFTRRPYRHLRHVYPDGQPWWFHQLVGHHALVGSYWPGFENTTLPGGDLDPNVGGLIATDAADIHLGPSGHVYSFHYMLQHLRFRPVVGAFGCRFRQAVVGRLDLRLERSDRRWPDHLNHATLNATQLTVDADGIVSGAGALGGPILNKAPTSPRRWTPYQRAWQRALRSPLPVSGSGTVEVGPAIFNAINGHRIPTSTRLAFAVRFQIRAFRRWPWRAHA